MTQSTKKRLRLLAAFLFLTGASAFLFAQPSRLPEAEIASAKAAYETWQERHNADIRSGRVSSAGPQPNVRTHTETQPALVLFGFVLCAVGIVAFIQSYM